MAETNEEMVLVSKKRLEALEALEKKQMEYYTKLRQKQQENPEAHATPRV